MQTIAAYGVVVVIGFVLVAVLVVIVSVFMASRLEQVLEVDLDARRLRLKVSVKHRPDAGAESGPSTQDPGQSASEN